MSPTRISQILDQTLVIPKIVRALLLLLVLQLGTVVNAASHPAVPLNSETPSDTPLLLSNTSNPYRFILTAVPDPWDLPLPTGSLTLEFYAYQAQIPENEFRACYEQALDEAAKELFMGGSRPMGPNPYHYNTEGVHLWMQVRPEETTTWYDWWLALLSFKAYGRNNGFRGMQFILLRKSPGGDATNIASGYLLAQ